MFTEFILFYHICYCMCIWPINLISTPPKCCSRTNPGIRVPIFAGRSVASLHGGCISSVFLCHPALAKNDRIRELKCPRLWLVARWKPLGVQGHVFGEAVSYCIFFGISLLGTTLVWYLVCPIARLPIASCSLYAAKPIICEREEIPWTVCDFLLARRALLGNFTNTTVFTD